MDCPTYDAYKFYKDLAMLYMGIYGCEQYNQYLASSKPQREVMAQEAGLHKRIKGA